VTPKLVFRCAGLLKRVFDLLDLALPVCGGPLFFGAIVGNAPTLDLEEQDAPIGVDDNEVDRAIFHTPIILLVGPGNAMEDVVVIVERLLEQRVDTALGIAGRLLGGAAFWVHVGHGVSPYR
jgi:hypothetical protein